MLLHSSLQKSWRPFCWHRIKVKYTEWAFQKVLLWLSAAVFTVTTLAYGNRTFNLQTIFWWWTWRYCRWCQRHENCAEDGRCVHNLNLSNYINHLPQAERYRDFSIKMPLALHHKRLGFKSRIEAGASTLLIDEDISATNLGMIRDERMQALG